MAGLLLAETEYRHQVEADIRPFRSILVGLFFIVVGLSIDLLLIAARWLDILLVVSALIIGKCIVTGLFCLAIGPNKETALRTGLLLSQGGEFGFIIFGATMATNVLGRETGQILVAAISLSMAVTPLMHVLGKRLSPLIGRGPALNLAATGQETDDLYGHIIIIGFGRVGQTVAKAFTLGGVDYVALDLPTGALPGATAKVSRCFTGMTPISAFSILSAPAVPVLRSSRRTRALRPTGP